MRLSRTHRVLALVLAMPILIAGGVRLSARSAQNPPGPNLIGRQAAGSYLVPTGQTVAPVGHHLTFSGRPVDMALSPDGKTLAVMLLNEVRFFDTARKVFRAETLAGTHDFAGIAWSRDGRTLYATGKSKTAGNDNTDNAATRGAVFITDLDAQGHPTERKPILFTLDSRIKPNAKAKDSVPSGLALSPDNKTLYVALFNNGTLAAVDLRSYDPATGSARIVQTPVGSSPECVAVSPTGDKIYVANRGGKVPEAGDTLDPEDPVVVDPETYKVATGTISVVDAARLTQDPAHAVTQTITVGLQPASLALSRDGSRLFAANANSDSVSVIAAGDGSVVETIPTSPAPGGLAASSPNGLAVSPDGRTLYVTLGGDNAVECLSLDRAAGGTASRTVIAGLIPTAWFPIGVRLDADGKSLFVANSKGIGSLGAPVTYHDRRGAATPQAGPGGSLGPADYPGHSVYAVVGSLSIIPVPDMAALADYTRQVARNDHFDRMAAALARKPDPFWARFKHVILVIKENRTYDQVLGDISVPAGHVGGDPHLVMFGEPITPNQHVLAHTFGLFDNLYCSGAISADGHHWLNEAFADDYDERAMNSYPRSYPCCGTDPLSFAGNTFLWQAALAQGLTFRDYGEFGPLPSIRRHADNAYDAKFVVTADRNKDVAHAERILADLQTGPHPLGLSQLTYIWFPNNHTSGTRPGAYTPESDVADNDRALGMLVEAVSHSRKYWRDEPTAIFVVEDDAQGGLDHVDGHRTVGLVISAFSKRGQIISANYDQLDMVRTMELMLGLRPLNQFDAAATPMREVFQDAGDFRPFTAEKNRIALNLKNPPAEKLSAEARYWAQVSSSLDFSAPDKADPEKLTKVLWHHTHGPEAYPPADASRG